MFPAKIATQVRHVPGKAAIIDIQGEINRFAEAVLNLAFAEATAAGEPAVVFNFAGLEYMNSSGIGLLVMLLVRAQRDGVNVLGCGLAEHYRHIFELTRLDEAIRLFPDEAAALASL